MREGVIFIEIITLYDQRNRRVGSVYPRRAKQLVLKGRAAWLEEGRSLKMTPDAPISLTAASKEELPMIDDNICQTNDGTEAAAPAPAESDDLLLYRAIQNVKSRRNLIKHIVAHVASWLVLAVFYASVFANMLHPSWWRASDILNNLDTIASFVPADYQWIIGHASVFITSYFRFNYVPAIFYLLLGAMLVWGGWLAARVAKHLGTRVAKRFRGGGKIKPDPIMQEYNRLKSMASNKIIDN